MHELAAKDGSARRTKIMFGLAAVFAIAAVALLGNKDFIYTLGAKPNQTAAPSSGYGFATKLTGLSAGDLSKRLDNMKAAGVTWVRYDLSWADVQPDSATSSDWAQYDTVTKAATGDGFKVLMIIDFAPGWAQAKGCSSNDICAPASPIAYAQFASAAAKHYVPLGVTDYEIWNEPNTAVRFMPAANPTLYARMLKDSYAAIKRVDATATVLTGGTAPSSTKDGDYSPRDFIKALYANGAGGWFDAVADHPYTYPLSPSQSGPADAWGGLSAIHSIMASHGDGGKQIWATEYGAPTNGPDPSNYVSEKFQAQSATQAVSIFHGYSWAGPFFWYDYMDSGTTTDTNENFYGLVRADGSHKPAYDAFVKAIAAQQ